MHCATGAALTGVAVEVSRLIATIPIAIAAAAVQVLNHGRGRIRGEK